MFKRLIASLVCLTFSFSNFQIAGAHDFSINQLPVPGTMVGESAPFAPLALKGLIVNPQKPLEFQFIVDTGSNAGVKRPNTLDIVESSSVIPVSPTVIPASSAVIPAQAGIHNQDQLKQQVNQLVKYFLAGLTIPESDLWVNLSPYEKDRMVPEALGQTNLGRDLLAQDYILKQLTASFIYPEKDLGKEFWSRVYAKAQEQFGTTNVPVNTFNKVWILPNQAQVFENGNAVYVTKSTLKVMLDEDYLALKKHTVIPASSNVIPVSPTVIPAKAGIHNKNDINTLGSQIVRQIILPEIEKEVNTGKNFAPLRQIYQALILAKWYKETIQNGLLDAVYTNKNKIAGINLDDPAVKEQIYNRYLQAYKKGAFNYIKEDPTPNGQVVPRKYFSGGITEIEPKHIDRGGSPAMISAKSWVAGVLLLVAVGLGSVANPASAQGANKLPNSLLPKEVPGNNKNFNDLFYNKQLYLEQTFAGDFREVVAYILSNGNKLEAIKALGKFGDKRAIGPLLKELKVGSSKEIRLEAAKAILKIRNNSPDQAMQTPKQTQDAAMFAKTRIANGPENDSKDHAMSQTPNVVSKGNQSVENGGIDLNQINVNRTGKTVNVRFDPAQLNELMQGGFEGFTPVIINITHISSPFQLLGIGSAKNDTG